MKTVINTLLGGATEITQGELRFSAEELADEAVVVDAELESAAAAAETPAVADSVEAAEVAEDELAKSEEVIESTAVAADNLGEAEQSLENLVELLNMESADLTQREYGMLMANANSILTKAGIDEGLMSFEESTDVAVPREEAKASLGEKAKALLKAGKDAVLKLIAEIGKYLATMFDSLARLRSQLVAMGKSVATTEVPEAEVELDAKYSLVMAGAVIAGVGRAADRIFGEHVASIKELGEEFAKTPVEEHSWPPKTQFRPIAFDGHLPGQPHFGDENHEPMAFGEDMSSSVAGFAFNVGGKLVGENPIKYKVSTRVARTEIAEMIRLCDQLSAAKKSWDTVVAETNRLYADEKIGTRVIKRLGMTGITGLYNVGPRRFVKYAVQVLGLRAGGLAKAIKQAQAPAAPAAEGDKNLPAKV